MEYSTYGSSTYNPFSLQRGQTLVLWFGKNSFSIFIWTVYHTWRNARFRDKLACTPCHLTSCGLWGQLSVYVGLLWELNLVAYTELLTWCPAHYYIFEGIVALVISRILILKIKPVNSVRDLETWPQGLPAFQTG